MSIYEKPGITITIWESIRKLKDKGVDIPELPVIELLIDDRNTIQHRFGHPSAESTYYYIEQAVNFFQRFLHHHYNIHLSEALKSHLSDEYLKLLGLVKDEFSFLDQLARVSIESSVLRASNIIAQEITKLLSSSQDSDVIKVMRRSSIWHTRLQNALIEDLEQKGFVPQNMVKSYRYLKEARNFAAHNPEEASVDWQAAFDIAKDLLKSLKEAEKAGYKFKPNEALSEALQRFLEDLERQKAELETIRQIEERRRVARERKREERQKIEIELNEEKRQDDDQQDGMLSKANGTVINDSTPELSD